MAAKKLKSKVFQATVFFEYIDIESLLCSALEGGSNYWYTDVKPLKKKKGNDFYANLIEFGFSIKDTTDCETEDGSDAKEYIVKPCIIQEKAMQLMANYQTKRHFTAVVDSNADAETGDVFLQLCVFGDVIYG